MNYMCENLGLMNCKQSCSGLRMNFSCYGQRLISGPEQFCNGLSPAETSATLCKPQRLMETPRPLNLIEYIWPCGHHENVNVQQAPGIAFNRGQFFLPIAKPPEDFTAEERTGVPGRCRCCRCWATYRLFKPHDVCKESNHPFSDCPTCMIVDSSGSHEIATIDHRPIGEFDQTPEFWRCNTCEHVNPFDVEGTVNGFLAPKVSDCMEDMECKTCGGGFTEDDWVVNSFWVYLGTWNGRVVAEGGPWHWNVEWHREHAGEHHTKDDCYVIRKNGRRKCENPCIDQQFENEEEEPSWVINHDHFTVVRNTYAILHTSAAHAYSPPGMTHDTLWDDDEEDVAVVDGEGLDATAPLDGGERFECEDEEVGLDEEVPRKGASGEGAKEAGEPLGGKAPEGDTFEERIAEEVVDEEPLEGEKSLEGEIFLEGEKFLGEKSFEGEETLDREPLDAETLGGDPVDEERCGCGLGEEAVPEGSPLEDGDFAEEGVPEEGNLDPEIGDDMLEDGERGLDEGFSEGDRETPVDGEGEFPPEDGEFPPEEGQISLEGESLSEDDNGFLAEGDEFADQVQDSECVLKGDGLVESESVDGEFAKGESVDGEFAEGEPADGRPAEGESMKDEQFAEGDPPPIDMPKGESFKEGYANKEGGQRDHGNYFGEQSVDGGFGNGGYQGGRRPYDDSNTDSGYRDSEYPQDNCTNSSSLADGSYDAYASGDTFGGDSSRGNYGDGGCLVNDYADSRAPADGFGDGKQSFDQEPAESFQDVELADVQLLDSEAPQDESADGGIGEAELLEEEPLEETSLEEQPLGDEPLDEDLPPEQGPPIDIQSLQPFDNQRHLSGGQGEAFIDRGGPFEDQRAPFEDQVASFEDQMAPFKDQSGPFNNQDQPFNDHDRPFSDQDQPFNDSFAARNYRDRQLSNDQYQEQPIDRNLGGQDGQDFGPDEARSEDDILPEFPAPQYQNGFGAVLSPPLQGGRGLAAGCRQYPHGQGPVEEEYYNTDTLSYPLQEYYTNELTEHNSDQNFASSEYVLGTYKNEKYQWLLSVISAATLGWGLEALEEQYYPANLKASEFSFKTLVAKLSGSKKLKDDPNASKDSQVGHSNQDSRAGRDVAGAGLAVNENGNQIDPNGEMTENDDREDTATTDQDRGWKDVDENGSPQDGKGRRRGLFKTFRNKKEGDLDAQDHQLQYGQDPAPGDGEGATIQVEERGLDVAMEDDGYAVGPNMTDPNAHPSTEQPRKRGFLEILFGGKKKQQDREAASGKNIDQGIDSKSGDSTDMDRDMSGQGPMRDPREIRPQVGVSQPVRKESFFATLIGKKSTQKDQDNRPAKERGFFTRLFGRKFRHWNSGVHNIEVQNTNQPAEKQGLFAVLFGSGKKFDQDTNGIGVKEHPIQTSPAKKKKGFFAVLSGSNKTLELSTNSDGITHPNPRESDFFATVLGPEGNTPELTTNNKGFNSPSIKKRSLFRRARTVSQQQEPSLLLDKQKKPGFFARLFQHRPKDQEADIERGNIADSPRVGNASPQLFQGGEFDARRSVMTGVLNRNRDKSFEDVPDKKNKKKQDTKHKNGTKGQLEDEEGDFVGARRAPFLKEQCAVRVPNSEGVRRHVSVPKQWRRGPGRAVAAAVNPRNWDWMDMDWK